MPRVRGLIMERIIMYFLQLTLVNGNPLLINAAQVVGFRADDSQESQTLIFSVDGEKPFIVLETIDDLLEMLPRAWRGKVTSWA